MKEHYKLAYIDMAVRFGETSQANRLKVGAILVKNGSIISEGCNGQPPGWHSEICEDHITGQTLETVNHAEINCLEKLWNRTETAKGSTMFISHSPCFKCAIKIKSAGIEQVYYRVNYRNDAGVNYLLLKGVKVDQI